MASREGVKKCIPKYFVLVRSFFVFFCTSGGSFYGLVAWNEPFIHFATVKLVRGVTEMGVKISHDCKP